MNDGAAAVGKYLTGYVVEKSLSVDNIFVISMIFAALAVALLLVVGGKMLAAEQFHAWLGPRFNLLVLATVVGILATGVATSLAAERRGRPAREEAAVGIP